MSFAKNSLGSKVLGRLTIAAATLLISALPIDRSMAQDWSFDPVIKVAGEYDDNAELDINTNAELEIEGLLIEGSADIGYASQQTSFELTPRYLMRRYSDNEELDSDDIFVRGAYRHRWTSSDLGLRFNFDQQSVRTGERADTDFDIEDADEISESDSGAVALRGERTRWRFTPSWGYRFSEKNSIGLDVNHYDVDFDEIFLNRLTDYTDTRGNFFFRRGLSNVNTGVLQLTGRRYDTADSDGEVTGYGAMAGIERALSETVNLRAMIGVESTEGAINSDDESNVVGNVTLVRNLQTIRMLAQYKRTINATGAGRLSTRDSIYLSFNRQLNDKISAGLGVRAYQSRGLDETVQVDDRDYVQLRSQIVWQMTRQFALEFDYRYTMLNRIQFGERANSNNILVWLTYEPNRVAD